MTKINFEFKAFPTPNDIPRPVIFAKFANNEGKFAQACIIDSGADYCALPKWVGEQTFGIDFDDIASNSVRHDFETFQHKHHHKFIEELLKNPKVIPSSSNCACGNTSDCWFYPLTLQLEDISFPVLVCFMDAENSLIGRLGVFDRFKAVVFNKKDLNGHFLIK